MQDIEQLPTEAWAQQLLRARQQSGLEVGALARELMLSPLQVRGLEAGSLSAFHGPGYYLRAVEKYARRLGIELDPPVTELKLTDSQLALQRVKNRPSAGPLASRHSNLSAANAMPGGAHRSRMGLWLAALVVLLLAAGFWLALKDGWPGNRLGEQPALLAEAATDTTTATLEPQGVPPSLTQSAPTGAAEVAVTAVEMTSQRATDSTSLSGSELSVSPPMTALSGALENDASPTEAVAALTQPPEPEVPSRTPEPVADDIEATFTADCWVEVRKQDGSVEQRIYTPDQTLTVSVEDIERLSFGNAQAVLATRAGEPFDIMRFTRANNNVARISAADLQ